MQIQCEQCKAKYKITIKKAPGKSVRFKCGKCQNMILIPAEAPTQVPAQAPVKIPLKVAAAAPVQLPTKIPTTSAGESRKETLQVTCINCGTGFVKQARDKSRLCYQCRIDAIVAKKRAKAAEDTAAGPKIEDQAAAHKYTIRNADGLVLGPIKLRTVAVLVREKRVHGNEEAKKDDGPFKALLEFPELAHFFPHLKPKPGKKEVIEKKAEEAPAAEELKEEEPVETEAAAEEEIEEEIDISIEEEELGAAVVEDEAPIGEAEAAPAEPEEKEEEPAPSPLEAEEEEDTGAAAIGLDEVSGEPEPAGALEEDEGDWSALDDKVKKVQEILEREGIIPDEEEEPVEEAEAEPEIEEKEEEKPKEKPSKGEGILGKIKPLRILRDRAKPEKAKEEEKEEEEIEELEEELEEIEELMEEVAEAPADDDSRYRIRYSDGMVLGPVKLSTVRDLFTAGNITGQEELQKEEGAWIPITECEGLKDLFGAGDEIGDDEIIELTETMEEV